MTEDKGNIEKMLQDNLKGRKVAVPDFVWGNVEKEIGAKKKRRGFFWLWGSGLSALLLLGGYVLWSNNGFTNTNVPCYFPSEESMNSTYLFNKYVGNENEFLVAELTAENETDLNEALEEELSASLEYSQNNSENTERVEQTHDGLYYRSDNLNDLLMNQQNDAANSQEDENDINSDISNDNLVNNDSDGQVLDTDPINAESNSDNANSQEVIVENALDKHVDNASDNDVVPNPENKGDDQTNLNHENDSDAADKINDSSTETDNENKPDANLDEPNDPIQATAENNLTKTINDSLDQLKKENEMAFIADQNEIDSAREIIDQIDENDSTKVSDVKEDTTKVETLTVFEALPVPLKKKWIVGLQGGYSAYDIAVFNEVFHSGVLSNRFFEASGWDLNVHLNYEVFNRFQLFGSLNYNQKTTFFDYAVRIDDQGYNEHIVLGNPLPLPEINDTDEESNCYLIEDVIANYTIQTVFFDLGFQYNFIQRPKFTLGSGLFIGGDLISNLRLNEASILAVTNTSANFSTLKYGIGVDANYWLTDRLAVSLAPKFQFLSAAADHAFYVGPVKEWITNVGLKYKF